MKQVQLHLIPTPGAKPEFLATIESSSKDNHDSNRNNNNGEDDDGLFVKLPSKIVLEGYTRDGWAWKPNPKAWKETKVVSVDGRKKLPGFVKYLKERQKAAYGRFSPTSIMVVSYVQKKHDDENCMTVRICWDMTQLDKCPFAKKPQQQQQSAAAATSSGGAVKKRKTGVLGNLLGAQNRTDQHMAKSAKKKATPAAAAAAGGVTATNAAGAATGGNVVVARTAQEVLAEFRQKLEQDMLDFDVSTGETAHRVKINLADTTRGLGDEDKARVTMDVLKYIVYEQAEEVNEEWIAHKEPSEFMDECTICVYKEGCAPPEVLEEVNRVELPEDVRGQQKAIQEARQRKLASQEAKLDQQRFSQAMQQERQDDDNLEALNVDRRDRRSIEEIQRDMTGGSDTKRIRTN